MASNEILMLWNLGSAIPIWAIPINRANIRAAIFFILTALVCIDYPLSADCIQRKVPQTVRRIKLLIRFTCLHSCQDLENQPSHGGRIRAGRATKGTLMLF